MQQIILDENIDKLLCMISIGILNNIKEFEGPSKLVCPRCSNCIFILDLVPGLNGLGKDNCKSRRESFKFCDLISFN